MIPYDPYDPYYGRQHARPVPFDLQLPTRRDGDGEDRNRMPPVKYTAVTIYGYGWQPYMQWVQMKILNMGSVL
jgi:hypothetical protein